MRVKFLHRFVLGAVLLSLAAACVQEEHPSAEFLEIDPRVEMNTVCTKVHTGSVDENLGKEYLVWDESDALTVWDQGNAGQYTFTNGRWYSPSPIRLTAGQTKTLYGLYDGTRNSGEPVSRVHASIRGDYSAGGYSVAKKPMAAKFGPAQVNGAVPFVFTPLFTQLSFVFRSAGTLTGLKVMGESPIAGDFLAQIGDNGNHSITLEGNLSNEVKMSALEDSSSNDYQKDTPYHCYILPNYTGPVSLQFQGTDGKPHYVVLNIPQAQKHYVFYIDLEKGEQPVNTDGYYLDVVSDGTDFVLENSGGMEKTVVKVVSYKRTNASGSSLELEPVPFRVEVFTGNRGSSADWADNSKWQPLTAGTPPSSLVYTNWVRLGGTSTVFDGGINSDPVAVTFQAGNHSVSLAGDGIEAQQATFLKNSTHRSGVANLDPSKPETAVDLSLYDATGKFITKGRSTANCYVINAPGWYKFPAVYGNAVIHGAVERQTFTDGTQRLGDSFDGSSSRGWLDYFEGKSHLVENAAEAKLIWQDGQGVISGNNDSSLAPRLVKNEDGFDFVYFYISPATVQACNAVIGVRDSAGNILWSWHIWVTPHLMETGDQKLSTMFLGWVDTESTTASYSYARGEIVRIVQLKADLSAPDPAGKVRYLTLSQKPSSLLGGTRYISQGRNSYYQVSRKDPFFSTKGGASTEYVKVWDGDGNVLIGDNVTVSSGISYNTSLLGSGPFFTITNSRPSFTWEQTIRMPWHFYLSNEVLLNYDIMNWGGRTNASTNYRGTSLGALKSVVDPSPYGFRTFDLPFNQDHSTWWGEGVTYCPAADTYYFPATGQMRGTSGFTIDYPLTHVDFFRFSVRYSSGGYFVSAGFREIRQNSTTLYHLNYGHMHYNPIRPVFDPESE